VRAGLVQRPQDAAAERQPDQHGQQQHHAQHAGRHQNHPLQRLAGARDCGLALLARIGLVSVCLLDVGRAAGGQHLVHQPVDLDAVPPLDRLLHGHERLLRERRIGLEHLLEQRAALGAGIGIAAQARQAGAGLLEQRVCLGQGLVAGGFQPALHAGLGVGQRGARLEQAAGHVGQVAGAFDAAAAQGFDIGPVVAQHRDAGCRRDGEQHHKQRQNGRYRRGDPEIFPHIHPYIAWRQRRSASDYGHPVWQFLDTTWARA